MSINKYISKTNVHEQVYLKKMPMKKYMSYISNNGSTNKHISDITENYAHEIYLPKNRSIMTHMTSLESMHINKYISKNMSMQKFMSYICPK